MYMYIYCAYCRSGYFAQMIEFLARLKSGELGGTRVRLDRLQVESGHV